MSEPSKHVPYFDASENGANADAASFVSMNPPPSYRTNDAASIAPSTTSLPDYGSNAPASPAHVLASPSAATTSQDNPDDKIIMKSIPITPGPRGRTNGLLGRFKPQNKLKIVLLPQSEYNKYFARDAAGNYVGTEPLREWTEVELDERYAQYKSALPPAPMKVGSVWEDGGGMAIARGGTYGIS